MILIQFILKFVNYYCWFFLILIFYVIILFLNQQFYNIFNLYINTGVNDFFITSFNYLSFFWVNSPFNYLFYFNNFIFILFYIKILYLKLKLKNLLRLFFYVILIYSLLIILNYEIKSNTIFINILLSNNLNLIHPLIIYLNFTYIISINIIQYLNNFNQLQYNFSYVFIIVYSFTIILGCWWSIQEDFWNEWWAWDVSEMTSLFFLNLNLLHLHLIKNYKNNLTVTNFLKLFLIFLLIFWTILQIVLSITLHSFLTSITLNVFSYFLIIIFSILFNLLKIYKINIIYKKLTYNIFIIYLIIFYIIYLNIYLIILYNNNFIILYDNNVTTIPFNILICWFFIQFTNINIKQLFNKIITTLHILFVIVISNAFLINNYTNIIIQQNITTGISNFKLTFYFFILSKYYLIKTFLCKSGLIKINLFFFNSYKFTKLIWYYKLIVNLIILIILFKYIILNCILKYRYLF